MRCLLLLLLFLSGIIQSALARIGDTEAEAATRYGPPTESEDGFNARHKIRLYHIKDYTIRVEFMDGRSQSEHLQKEDRSRFSETEADTILSANKPPALEEPAKAPTPAPPNPLRTWSDPEGRKIEAEFRSLDSNTLTVQTKNGKSYRLDLGKLVPEDQEAARKLQKLQHPPALPIPKAAAKADDSKWKAVWGNDTVGFHVYLFGDVLVARRDDNERYFIIQSQAFKKFKIESKAEFEKTKLKGF